MNGNNEDQFTLKLRSTLFQIKRKGLNSLRGGCSQSPLVGVTLMTKRYKSKRCIQAYQNHSSHRNFNQNEVKTEIFKRLASKNNKRSTGLDISKAVIHFNQCKKARVSTQRSFDSNEENQITTSSKGSLYKKLVQRKQALAIHRQNQSQFRFTNRDIGHAQGFWYSGSVHTQIVRHNRMNKSKIKSMEMQGQRLESIEGWKVQNIEDNDYF